MTRRMVWLTAPLFAVAAWLLVRHPGDARDEQPRASTAERASSSAPGRAGDAVASDRAPASAPPAPTAIASAGAGAPGAIEPGTVAPSRPWVARGTPASGAVIGAPPRPAPERSAGSADDAPGGKLTDRTGWGDPNFGRRLNQEFMPLASECIDQAKARRPGLKGLLAFSMVLAPTETGKAIVSSIQTTAANQIEDPELFECIRESSFSLDGLKAPHDFDITMPID